MEIRQGAIQIDVDLECANNIRFVGGHEKIVAFWTWRGKYVGVGVTRRRSLSPEINSGAPPRGSDNAALSERIQPTTSKK